LQLVGWWQVLKRHQQAGQFTVKLVALSSSDALQNNQPDIGANTLNGSLGYRFVSFGKTAANALFNYILLTMVIYRIIWSFRLKQIVCCQLVPIVEEYVIYV